MNTTTTNINQKTTTLGGVNIFVTGGNNQDAEELARTAADEINDMLDEEPWENRGVSKLLPCLGGHLCHEKPEKMS